MSDAIEIDAERNRRQDAAAARIANSDDFVPMEQLRKGLDRATIQLDLSPIQTSQSPLPPREVYLRARDAVVVVGRIYKCDRCPNWHLNGGSGFIIDSSAGIVVTNYHVVDQAPERNKTLAVADHRVRVFPVRQILAASKAHDLAILKIDLKEVDNLPALPLADAPADVATPAHVIHHPGGRYYTFTSGFVSRRFESRWANQTIPMISITAEYALGSSGAPVLNDRGQVIGIVARTSPLNATINDNPTTSPSTMPAPTYAQMVERRCVPVESLRDMIIKPQEQ
ncbi:S1 family peptidase [Fontivita pretiosa]|uniref:S1 family peptidase n=1 Tax=Fontivita pretiosa TaxID=2989684 RepID=UPI003D171B68